MKPKILLCLALGLGGGLAGCSSVGRHSANSEPAPPDLYLHLFASFVYPEPPHLILSAPIHLSSDFDILMDNHEHLKGRVDPRNGKFLVHFQGLLCSGTNVFDGEVELEQRYVPGPQPYDTKAPFICQPHFVLSSKFNPKPFLKRQAAAEKQQWHLENPLTARQIAQVKSKFHLMRPGMTKDEVFAMLGLSGYQNRLLPSSIGGSNYGNMGDYQLADGERLRLFFDATGMKTKAYQLADGTIVHLLDYTGDITKRLVVRAELDTITQSGNAPPVWRTISQWP
jgi:hypothetical protein